jgi:NADPH-dependent F420 reductase
MDVSIIGTGNMARGIGHRLVAGGHAVTVIGRDMEDAQRLATELGALASARGLDGDLQGEVVVLAVWYAAVGEIVGKLGQQLADKIVVDITNPLNATYDGLVTAPGTSAAEENARLLPAGAKLVKAFNTTFAPTLAAGQVGGLPLDVFIAGDDQAAKRVVAQLARDGGLNAIDIGPLRRSRELEAMAFLGITLQGPLNLGFQSAWKLLS